MNKGLEINFQFHMPKGRRRRHEIREGEATKVPIGRLPRVTRLMALAIRFDKLICDGVVRDQAELARLGRVTRARLTQIMNLINLAPTIQEEILEMQPIEKGRDPIIERDLRSIAATSDWHKQRGMWNKLKS